MPIPALNIIAIQETVRNSGASPSRPSGIRPYRLTASHSANTTNPLAASTNAHPPTLITPLSTADITALMDSVCSNPHAMNATTSAADDPNTHRSTPVRPSGATCGMSSGMSSGISLESDGTCRTMSRRPFLFGWGPPR
jgi:hypothetical protein